MRRHFPGALRHPKSRAGLGRLPLAGLLGVVLVAGATPAPRASAAPASVRTQTATHSAMAPDGYERRVQHWVNVKRNNRDLRALRIARCTDRSAERWSGHLARTDTFYHQSMRKLLRRCDARYAGETSAAARWPHVPWSGCGCTRTAIGGCCCAARPAASASGPGPTPQDAGSSRQTSCGSEAPRTKEWRPRLGTATPSWPQRRTGHPVWKKLFRRYSLTVSSGTLKDRPTRTAGSSPE